VLGDRTDADDRIDSGVGVAVDKEMLELIEDVGVEVGVEEEMALKLCRSVLCQFNCINGA
jgi:hypothetical protein